MRQTKPLLRIAAFVTLVSALNLAPAAAQVVAVTSLGATVSLMTADEIGKLSPLAKEIYAADQKWADAYRSCDMTLMDQVLHDDIVFIHAHARVDTKAVLMKTFACGGKGAERPTLVQPIRVIAVTPDTGVVEAAMQLGQPSGPIKSLITRIYVRQNGNWRLIAHQTTRNPGVDENGKPMPDPASQTASPAPSTPAGVAR